MTSAQELHNWLNGTPTGGPNGDGRYPLTFTDGETYLVYCPAAQALDPTLDPSEVEVFVNTAVLAATEANLSATAASTSASNASASATAADTSRSQALSYRNTASTHATTATTKAGEAASSASAAAGSATTATTANTNAQSAKTAAETARNKAQDWADKAEDSTVETGKYSARHWAAKAAAFAGGMLELTWANITGKPTSFPPSNHTHTIANVTGLQTGLDAKFDSPSGTTSQYIRGNGSLATFPSIPAGTVTSVTGGNGLSGTVTSSGSIALGTPGTITATSTNSVSTSSHTHSLDTSVNYSWTGTHTFGAASGISDIYLASAGTTTGGIFSDASRTVVHTNDGYVALRPSGRGSASGELLVTATGITHGTNIVWHSGNFDPSGYVVTGRSITAGNGLSGGGTLAANRTVTLGTPGTLSGSTSNAVQTSSHTHALSTNLSAWDGYHPDNAYVDKGTIPGSANLNDYRTTGIYHQNANADATSGTNYPANSAGMLTVFENSAMTYQTYQIYNTGDVYTRSRYNTNWSVWKLSVDGTTTISAGNGLSGGGTLAANRTITLGTPGTLSGSTTNSVSTSSHTHALSTNLTAWDGKHPNSFVEGTLSNSDDNSTVVLRTGSADIYARLFRSTYASGNMGTGASIAFRNNDSSDNYIRFTSNKANMRTWLELPNIFVQSGDPGSNASTGDLWIWSVGLLALKALDWMMPMAEAVGGGLV